MTLLWKLVLLKLLLGIYASENHVLHPNIGVLFKEIKNINLASSTWRHTVAIELFHDINVDEPTVNCFENSTETQCPKDLNNNYRKTLWRYHNLEKELVKDIREKEDIIKHIMINKQKVESKRQKRAWVSFLGDIAKKVIGVATEKDIQVLQQHMDELAVMVESRSEDKVHNIKQMHSYELKLNDRINVADARIDNIQDMVASGSQATKGLQDLLLNKLRIPERLTTVQLLLDKSNIWVNTLFSYSVHLQSLAAINNIATERISDAVKLLDGRLPINFINPRELENILHSVSEKLLNVSPNFKVQNNTQYYYHHSRLTTSTFDDRHIYITINIPFRDKTQDFTVYEVEAVPIPIGHRNNDPSFTLVSGFSKYLAVSKDGTQYIEYNDDQASKQIKSQEHQHILPKSINQESCSIKLFEGNSDGIFRLCKQLLLEKVTSFPEFIYSIGANEYLVYAPLKTFDLVCDDKLLSQTVHSKGLFKIDLNCSCHLAHADLKIHPEKSTCHNSTSSIGYSANLLAYEAIYKDKINLDLTPQNFVNDKISFEFPDTSRFKKSDALLQNIDAETVKELGKISEIANMSSPSARDRMLFLFHWWNSVTDHSDIVMLIVDIAIYVLYGAAIAWLYRKLSKAQQRLLILGTIIGASEALEFKMPTAMDPVNSVRKGGIDHDLWKTIIAVMSLILATYAVLQQWFDKCRKSSCHNSQTVTLGRLRSELYLCLYSYNEHLHLRILVIPSSIENVRITKLGVIPNVTFKRRCLQYFLRVDWSPIQFTIPHIGRVALPSSIRLPLSKWRAFKRMSRTYHTVKVVLVSEDKLREFSSYTSKQAGTHAYQPLPRWSLRESTTTEEASTQVGETNFQVLPSDPPNTNQNSYDSCEHFI